MSRKSRLTRERSEPMSPVPDGTMEYLESLEAVAGGSEEETRTMRVVLFDEDGPHDMGSLGVGEVHSVVGQAVGKVPQGWQHVDTESDEHEEFQQALDEEGVDPEDDGLDETGWDGVSGNPGVFHGPDAAHELSQEETDAIYDRVDDEEEFRAGLALLVPPMETPPTSPIVVPEPTPRMAQERLEMRIRLVSTSNPKRPGTTAWASWEHYVDGMTVSAYLASHDRRRARRDLQWDVEHGFVRLETQAEWVASGESQT